MKGFQTCDKNSSTNVLCKQITARGIYKENKIRHKKLSNALTVIWQAWMNLWDRNRRGIQKGMRKIDRFHAVKRPVVNGHYKQTCLLSFNYFWEICDLVAA